MKPTWGGKDVDVQEGSSLKGGWKQRQKISKSKRKKK